MTAAPLIATVWNGVRLDLPASWYPTVILKDCLFFESEGTRVLDVKWSRRAAPRTPGQLHRRLNKDPSTAYLPVEPEQAALQERTDGVRPSCFSWRSDSESGTAYHLYCPACSTAALLRFHDAPPAAASVLEQFRCHREPVEGLHPWMILDLDFALPADAVLLKHEFLVGRYHLQFQSGQHRFSLHRFKPAGHLLAQQSLRAFGAPLAEGQQLTHETEHAVEWQLCLQGGKKIKARLRRRATHRCLRIWHQQQHNVLLALGVEGNHPFPPRLWHRICRSCTAR